MANPITPLLLPAVGALAVIAVILIVLHVVDVKREASGKGRKTPT